MSACENCDANVEGFEICPHCSVEIETKAPHGAYGPSSPATASQEGGEVRPLAIRLGGGFLRFLGMCLIVVTGIALLIGASSSETLVMFSVGVGMHFLGRKITPGKVGVGASAGGGVMGVLVAAGLFLLALWFVYMTIMEIFGPLITVIFG